MKDFNLDFRLYFDGDAGGYQVHLTADGREARAPLDFTDPRLQLSREAIEENNCSKEVLREVGSQLWSALMAGEVGELFETLRQENGRDVRYAFRLRLEDPGGSEEVELMPWEALYEENPRGGAKFLANHPGFVIVRTPFGRAPSPPAPPLAPPLRPLRVLVVVPEGSGLGNVEREWKNVEAALAQAGMPVAVERLAGGVTPARLREKLRSQDWDVFHFIGHGRADRGRTEIRINSEEGEEFWMDGGDLADLFQGTGLRLAVLNCCLGATPVKGRRLTGMGPAFLNAGAPAVVAMRYEIGDREANDFAKELYRELFLGREPGRVDLAVESARESLYINQPEDVGRPFITPVLFLAGDPRIFDLGDRPAARTATVPVVAPAATRMALPDRLVQAFSAGRLVPVIGPRVLTAGAVRSGLPIADAGEVARSLARRFSYPRMEDFTACETIGDWMDSFLLQWVCQRFCDQRREIAKAVDEMYRGVAPPALLLHIAGWNVPGAFYLHFDGLLEEAFASGNRKVRVVDGVRRPVSQGDQPLLVHVKGNFRDWSSLVLTEDEHNRLWDDVGSMDQDVLNLVRGYSGQSSRSLFFLGANPRDPLVKRLFSKLAENWAGAHQEGSVFFLCGAGEKGDPYWDQFKVQWIEADVEDVVNGLTGVPWGGAR